VWPTEQDTLAHSGFQRSAFSHTHTHTRARALSSSKLRFSPHLRSDIFALFVGGLASPRLAQVNQKRVTKKKVFKTTSRKKDAIREDLGHLPPQQRERAFLERLELTNSARDRELKAKVGFEKTIEAYTANPAMGDKKVREVWSIG
jgi:hypothetical protein